MTVITTITILLLTTATITIATRTVNDDQMIILTNFSHATEIVSNEFCREHGVS